MGRGFIQVGLTKLVGATGDSTVGRRLTPCSSLLPVADKILTKSNLEARATCLRRNEGKEKQGHHTSQLVSLSRLVFVPLTLYRKAAEAKTSCAGYIDCQSRQRLLPVRKVFPAKAPFFSSLRDCWQNLWGNLASVPALSG